MFKKLKTRFILINMTLLTIVFISIFSFLYFMTNHSINRETNMNIDSLMNNSPKQKPNSGNIVVELDNSGNITNYFVHLNYDMTTVKLQNAINTIYESNKNNGKIKIDDYIYKYEKKEFQVFFKDCTFEYYFRRELKNKINSDFCFGRINKSYFSFNNKYLSY